jgi:hypothetical protein
MSGEWKFMRDDGTEVTPDISKPALCVSCQKDGMREEEVLCTLTRIDQQGDSVFECDAFEPRTSVR